MTSSRPEPADRDTPAGQPELSSLGLPLVRTSPDHGTAFDIAGQGRADDGSMREAFEVAREMAANERSAGA